MHTTGTVQLACIDCHGGHGDVMRPSGPSLVSDMRAYERAKHEAHPKPSNPVYADSSANPVRAYADWLKEDKEYIRFINPGDLRVVDETCGNCHVREVRAVQTSMMTHGGMLWQAALYNNGGYPYKNARFGESYSPDGQPQRIMMPEQPSQELTRTKGILPYLDPIARWEVSQPGNILRVFERGGEARAESGIPNPESRPGLPDDKLSDRGLGTLLRTDPVFLGLQKTRLLDPLLSFPGTNDHPGDYRHSGCTACHVIYANDRNPVHSGPYAAFGNQGRSAQMDPTIPKNESGHPIKHELTRAIPTSQCIVCHIHPGTNMVASYLGYIWWDSETDGANMYPAKQHDPTDAERLESWMKNPQNAAARGPVGRSGFPGKNRHAGIQRPAPAHPVRRFPRPRLGVSRGIQTRSQGQSAGRRRPLVPPEERNKFQNAVHLKDIHLEKGMHCTDCHFERIATATGICTARHATRWRSIAWIATGPSRRRQTCGPPRPLRRLAERIFRCCGRASGQRRFYQENGKIYQRSNIDPGRSWEVVQVVDTITPGNPHYSEASRLAKTMLKDGTTWGSNPGDEKQLAHGNDRMTCYACHSSWTTSCFGCHLPMRANAKSPMLHNEGQTTRNYTAYNFEVLRDDIYMLGVDGTVTEQSYRAHAFDVCGGGELAERQSRLAILQQQTISAEGFSGFGFSSYYPHTVRAKETKTCTSCHVSREGDNNAWMAQLLMQGTNLVNMMGRYVYVAEGRRALTR